MMSQTLNPAQMTDVQKSAHIKAVVLDAGVKLRERHTWLRHQDAIGAGVMILSLLGMIASGTLYVQGVIPWWICVPVTTLFASFIHELEHDLIHIMYFRKQPKVIDFMLLMGWLARASTVSPFVRRKLHLHHHKFSGTESDLEERGITNGETWNLRRFIMIGDNMMAVALRPKTMIKATRAYIKSQNPPSMAVAKAMGKEQATAYFPIGTIYYLLFHTWVVVNAVLLFAFAIGHALTLPAMLQSALNVLDVFAVVYMLPCLLRTFSIHFISSNMHYYGDVEAKNVMQQCQVLNPWWLMPLQLFCFNFGSTHAIHHFAVKEPFYIRQANAKIAHKVMREMGVRFNDFGTFRRANRFMRAEDIAASKTAVAGAMETV